MFTIVFILLLSINEILTAFVLLTPSPFLQSRSSSWVFISSEIYPVFNLKYVQQLTLFPKYHLLNRLCSFKCQLFVKWCNTVISSYVSPMGMECEKHYSCYPVAAKVWSIPPTYSGCPLTLEYSVTVSLFVIQITCKLVYLTPNISRIWAIPNIEFGQSSPCIQEFCTCRSSYTFIEFDLHY